MILIRALSLGDLTKEQIEQLRDEPPAGLAVIRYTSLGFRLAFWGRETRSLISSR